MKKKIVSILVTLCLFMCMVGCGETKPEDNVAFESVEEMQKCLNGKWFSISDGGSLYPIYTEIVFNNDEIKKCQVYGWTFNEDKGENGERELKIYENIEFKSYESTYTPQFKYKIGRVQFGTENLNIDIKEYVDIVEETEVKEKYLLIGNSVYFKATDKIDLSGENFKTFEKFCEITLSKDFSNPFTSMYYSDGNKELGIEEGIDDDDFYIYEGCDSDDISFEICKYSYTPVHYFARTDEFSYLYEELKDLFLRRTNIIGLIGTKMPDFEKKDWAKNHIFKELDYYLYMNTEGKLVSNIS